MVESGGSRYLPDGKTLKARFEPNVFVTEYLRKKYMKKTNKFPSNATLQNALINPNSTEHVYLQEELKKLKDAGIIGDKSAILHVDFTNNGLGVYAPHRGTYGQAEWDIYDKIMKNSDEDVKNAASEALGIGAFGIQGINYKKFYVTNATAFIDGMRSGHIKFDDELDYWLNNWGESYKKMVRDPNNPTDKELLKFISTYQSGPANVASGKVSNSNVHYYNEYRNKFNYINSKF